MAALLPEVKVAIVTALACFDSPQQVAAMVKERFGVTVTPQQLQAYNPASHSGVRLSAKLKKLFADTRKRFQDDVSEIPIANQAYRLRVLNRALERVEKSGNVAMMSTLLEQAAREAGGAFTNRLRHEHGGAGGGPIEQRTTVVDERDVKAALAKLQEDY